jgi:hypothetical protein
VNGLVGTDAAGMAATWVAAAVTIAVWSYFAGATRIFRLAQYLLAGLATGFLVLVALREVLWPLLVAPLLTDPAGDVVPWIGLGLVAVLVASRWLPPLAGSVPVAILVAATAAFALGGAVVGTLLPQLGASVLPLSPGPSDVVNGIASGAITVVVLFGFLHGTRRGRAAALAAGTGRWLLLGGIGGWLGFLLVSRLALLVDRVAFLLGDWLGLVP